MAADGVKVPVQVMLSLDVISESTPFGAGISAVLSKPLTAAEKTRGTGAAASGGCKGSGSAVRNG